MGDEIVGAGFRGFEESWIAAVFVGQGETVERPAQSARPAGIAAVALLRALPQKLAGLQIEDAFLRRGTVATNQDPSRCQAVAQRDVAQTSVARFARGIEDDPNIHHHIDKERIFADERSQILAVLLEA